MKDLSKTELLIMKCVWVLTVQVTATTDSADSAGKYQMNLTADQLGTLMYRH